MNENIEVFEVNTPHKKRYSFLIMLIWVLVLLVFGLYRFTNTFSFLTNKDNISSIVYPNLILKDFSVELGSKVSNNIDDYLVDISSNTSMYNLVISTIPMNNSYTIKLGSFKYSIVSNAKTYEGNYNIIDTTAPTIYLKKIYCTIDEVSNIKVNDFIIKKYDLSSSINVSYINGNELKDISSEGNYEVNIKATDSSNNEVTAKSYLKIISTKIIDALHDNNPSYNSLDDSNWDGTYAATFDLAALSTSAIYKTVINSLNSIDWLNIIKTKYPLAIVNEDIETMDIYNQSGFIIGVAVRTSVKEDGVNKIIYLKK